MFEKYFAELNWSKSGTILTIIFFFIATGLSIYIFILSEDLSCPEISWVINNEENLVELKEQIQGVKITFNGTDILETQEEIKIINISLVNSGKEILQGEYDQNLPFGLKFDKASIISFKFVDASDTYLRNSSKVLNFEKLVNDTNSISFQNQITSDELILSKLILDRNSFINFKIYLKQKTSDTLLIKTIGKISGINEIPIIRKSDISQEEKLINIPNLSLFLVIINIALLTLIIINISRYRRSITDKLNRVIEERKI